MFCVSTRLFVFQLYYIHDFLPSGPMVIVPVMSYWWLVEDTLIGFLGAVSLLFAYVLRGTAYDSWILYLGNFLAIFVNIFIEWKAVSSTIILGDF